MHWYLFSGTNKMTLVLHDELFRKYLFDCCPLFGVGGEKLADMKKKRRQFNIWWILTSQLNSDAGRSEASLTFSCQPFWNSGMCLWTFQSCLGPLVASPFKGAK